MPHLFRNPAPRRVPGDTSSRGKTERSRVTVLPLSHKNSGQWRNHRVHNLFRDNTSPPADKAHPADSVMRLSRTRLWLPVMLSVLPEAGRRQTVRQTGVLRLWRFSLHILLLIFLRISRPEHDQCKGRISPGKSVRDYVFMGGCPLMVHCNGAGRYFPQRKPADPAGSKSGMIIAAMITDSRGFPVCSDKRH